MYEYLWRFKRLSTIATCLLVYLSCSAAMAESSVAESPDSLQAKLVEAESNYKSGKLDVAITQATSLIGTRDSSFMRSDKVARDAKADLCVFQIKAGHPDESARLIRELLVSLQLCLPADPRYATEPAIVYGDSPKLLKDEFASVVTRVNESKDTKLILDSLVDNTVPKDYAAQLKKYCSKLDLAMKPLDDLKSIADTEELRYGDPLRDLDAEDPDGKSDPRLSASSLEAMGKTLNEIATEAQQVPVGDVRPAFGLYRLALLANSAQRYQQAEAFARQSIEHTKALSDDIAGFPDVELALAFALAKQSKNDDFRILKVEILKNIEDRERLLFAMARLTATTGDTEGALAIYKKALDVRKAHGDARPPEWIDCYNALLQKAAPN